MANLLLVQVQVLYFIDVTMIIRLMSWFTNMFEADMVLGIGLTAKFIEEGGADMIIIYNSGRFRMAGRGSLAGLMPYGNANEVVVEMVSACIHPICSFSFP